MLKKLRERIDWLDEQIASLLSERMKAADQVGKIKKAHTQKVIDVSREENVLAHVENVVQHPVLKESIGNIYKDIMLESKRAQQFLQHTVFPFRRIGIIGLGLIGGSISKGIKMKDPSIQIIALEHPSLDLNLAEEGKWIDQKYATVVDLMQQTELILLTSPLSTIISFAEEIRRHAPLIKKLVIMDVASVKEEITTAFATYTCEQIEYISTHPMTGKEEGGFAHSQATLFVQRPWVIVPHLHNSVEGLEKAEHLIQFLGAQPLRLDAQVHDAQAALISHIPHILSKAYLDFVRAEAPESLQIAGSGFQSFTRIAADNPSMHCEIQTCNKKAIATYLNKFKGHISL